MKEHNNCSWRSTHCPRLINEVDRLFLAMWGKRKQKREQNKQRIHLYLALYLSWSCYGDQKAIISMLLKRRSSPPRHSFTPLEKMSDWHGQRNREHFHQKKHDVTSASQSQPDSQLTNKQTEQNSPFFPLNKSPLDRPRSETIPPAFMLFWNTSCCELADPLASTNSLRTEWLLPLDCGFRCLWLGPQFL